MCCSRTDLPTVPFQPAAVVPSVAEPVDLVADAVCCRAHRLAVADAHSGARGTAHRPTTSEY